MLTAEFIAVGIFQTDIKMKKYFYLFFVALFATMSFGLTSCGDDDDEPGIPDGPNDGGAAFIYNGEKLYLRDSGTFDNIKIDNMMQMAFSLYKTSDPLSGEEPDLYPVASAFFEIKPFDVTSTSKGTKLEVITSRYTYIEDLSKGFSIGSTSVEGVEYYFKPTAGEVTFEGYDSKNNTVTVNVNLTMANPSKSATLKGTVVCEYEADSYVSFEYGGGDYPY